MSKLTAYELISIVAHYPCKDPTSHTAWLVQKAKQALAEMTDPTVTVDYPLEVTAQNGEICDGPDDSVFEGVPDYEWEPQLAAQLDPTKRYRLELRFFEVEE